MAFATVSDYLARFPDSTVPQSVIAEMLDEASDLMEGELAESTVEWEQPSEAYAAKLKRVCVDIAHRAEPDGGTAIPFGATQASQTAGSYTVSASMPGGYGELYLTRSDRIKLGIGGGSYFYAEPYGGQDV